MHFNENGADLLINQPFVDFSRSAMFKWQKRIGLKLLIYKVTIKLKLSNKCKGVKVKYFNLKYWTMEKTAAPMFVLCSDFAAGAEVWKIEGGLVEETLYKNKNVCVIAI